MQGHGDPTLELSNSYAIDTSVGTIALDGSGPNTLTGFDVFDLQGVVSGDNTFTVGSFSQELELGGGFNTVIVTPNSGDLTITGATQSNLVLDFQGFGSALATLAQLEADVSITAANTELIALPNEVTITLQETPISLNRLNVVLPANPALPPPPADNLPASAINEPVVGAAGTTTVDDENGQSASTVFDQDLFTQAILNPSVTGGNGSVFNDAEIGQTSVGNGGAASLTLQDDILGAGGTGAVTINAISIAGSGASASELEEGQSGGTGGSSTTLFDGISEASSAPVSLAATADGGAGGMGVEYYVSGNGGEGGDASVTLSNSVFNVSGNAGTAGNALGINLATSGGAGGIGGSAPEYPSYGNGGQGGNGSASLTSNVFSAGDIELSVTAAVAAAAPPGSSTALPIFDFTPAPGSGAPGVIGMASLAVTNNQVDVDTAGGTLSLMLGAPGAPSLVGALTFTGNSFQGEGDSTLDLALSSGSYAIDTSAGTIALAGSAANALSGFDVFDMLGVASGSNSFVAGSGAETLEIGGGVTTVQLGEAVTTVVITPQAGDLKLVGATSSNVILEFEGFGTAFDSLQQLAADTTVSDGMEQITLSDGTLIDVAGTALLLNASDVSFGATTPINPVVTLGAGPSTLALFLSDLDQVAHFTISVDGTQIGGVQTTSADGSLGQE